jgi:general secretion pathway protein J
MTARKRAIQALQRRRRSEAGLTLIELLISLTLLVIITGFLAGGVTMASRAFAADRDASAEAEIAAGLDALAGLIGTALPIPTANGGSRINFDGQSDSLTFIGLSGGHALPGGPLGFRIRRQGKEIEVEVLAADGISLPQGSVRSVAIHDIASLHFSYFGRPAPGMPASWQAEWRASDHLPDLVAIRVGFIDPWRDRPALVVALRQG